MKKLVCMLLLLASLLTVVGCDNSENGGGDTACSHSWREANCKTPKTCTKCGETEGDAIPDAHNYVDNTCQNCGIVQLTLYNYEDYIECAASVSAGNSYYNSTYGKYVYTSLDCEFEASGNTHYEYKNVCIEVKFFHYDQSEYLNYLVGAEATPRSEKTCFVYLSLAGNGSKTTTVYTAGDRYCTSLDLLFTCTNYEVVSVSGTVRAY